MTRAMMVSRLWGRVRRASAFRSCLPKKNLTAAAVEPGSAIRTREASMYSAIATNNFPAVVIVDGPASPLSSWRPPTRAIGTFCSSEWDLCPAFAGHDNGRRGAALLNSGKPDGNPLDGGFRRREGVVVFRQVNVAPAPTSWAFERQGVAILRRHSSTSYSPQLRCRQL